MQLSIRFDMEFTEDLNDQSSSAFKKLESDLNTKVSTISKGRQVPISA